MEQRNLDGLWVKTNGKIEEVKVPDLEAMQRMVGGLIQALPINEGEAGFSVYINEEGRLKELPINMTMTLFLLRNNLWPGLAEPLHGDILILGATGAEGESTSVNEGLIETLPKFWVEPRFEIVSLDSK